MIPISRYYRAVRAFSVNRKPWQDAIRYQTLIDERHDLTLVSWRVYGNNDDYIAIMAAAGIDRFDQPLDEQVLVLPTLEQLEVIKQSVGGVK